MSFRCQYTYPEAIIGWVVNEISLGSSSLRGVTVTHRSNIHILTIDTSMSTVASFNIECTETYNRQTVSSEVVLLRVIRGITAKHCLCKGAGDEVTSAL